MNILEKLLDRFFKKYRLNLFSDPTEDIDYNISDSEYEEEDSPATIAISSPLTYASAIPADSTRLPHPTQSARRPSHDLKDFRKDFDFQTIAYSSQKGYWVNPGSASKSTSSHPALGISLVGNLAIFAYSTSTKEAIALHLDELSNKDSAIKILSKYMRDKNPKITIIEAFGGVTHKRDLILTSPLMKKFSATDFQDIELKTFNMSTVASSAKIISKVKFIFSDQQIEIDAVSGVFFTINSKTGKISITESTDGFENPADPESSKCISKAQKLMRDHSLYGRLQIKDITLENGFEPEMRYSDASSFSAASAAAAEVSVPRSISLAGDHDGDHTSDS